MPARTADEVLAFWFSAETQPNWFVRSEAFDARMRDALGPLHTQAARGELDSWTATPRGALALILLLDQAPATSTAAAPTPSPPTPAPSSTRAPSSTPATTASSPSSSACSSTSVRAQRIARRPGPQLRAHPPAPDRPVGRVRRQTPGDHRPLRPLPHRNAILGRESTAAELEFLKQPGSSF